LPTITHPARTLGSRAKFLRPFEVRIMRDKNITVTVSSEAYRQARIWAAQHDTSISAVVEYLIQTLPGIPRAAREFPEPYPVPANTGHATSIKPLPSN
jgi:hypothetical protein